MQYFCINPCYNFMADLYFSRFSNWVHLSSAKEVCRLLKKWSISEFLKMHTFNLFQEEERARQVLYFNSDRHRRLEDYQTPRSPVKISNFNNKNPDIQKLIDPHSIPLNYQNLLLASWSTRSISLSEITNHQTKCGSLKKQEAVIHLHKITTVCFRCWYSQRQQIIPSKESPLYVAFEMYTDYMKCLQQLQ